jgi:hypothetical protein
MENFMKQLAALQGREPGLGWVPCLRAEALGGESFERALRLRSERGGAAWSFAGREGKLACVVEVDGERGANGGSDEVWWQWLGRANHLQDKPGRPRFDAFALARIAEADFGR